MVDTLDVATADIAAQVHRHLIEQHYQRKLSALQVRARSLGYRFAHCDEHAADLPVVLTDALADALTRRQLTDLAPEGSLAVPSSVQRDEMLSALGSLGIHLSATGEAPALLEAEATKRAAPRTRRLMVNKPTAAKPVPLPKPVKRFLSPVTPPTSQLTPRRRFQSIPKMNLAPLMFETHPE